MNCEQVIAFIRGLTYKPGSKIELSVGQTTGTIHLVATLQTVNVDDPTQAITVRQVRPLTIYDLEVLTPDTLADEVWALIVDLEAHEVSEWLRFRGQPLRDPHPDR